jgi:hypothetical protein
MYNVNIILYLFDVSEIFYKIAIAYFYLRDENYKFVLS